MTAASTASGPAPTTCSSGPARGDRPAAGEIPAGRSSSATSRACPRPRPPAQLNWSERTLRRRLAEARERLKVRLARRGLVHDDAVLEAVFLREARAAVPPAWKPRPSARHWTPSVPPSPPGPSRPRPESLTQEVLEAMFFQKLTIASAALIGAGLMAWAASAALISRGDEPPKAAPAAARPAAAPRARSRSRSARRRRHLPGPRPRARSRRQAGCRTQKSTSITTADPAEPRVQHRPRGPEGPRGRERRRRPVPLRPRQVGERLPLRDCPAWHGAQIAAVAPGLAMAWVDAGSLLKGDEATLRLVRDDVPIRGRVVDPQGRPVAGVTVRLRQVGAIEGRTPTWTRCSPRASSTTSRPRPVAIQRRGLAGRPGNLDDRRRRPVQDQRGRPRPGRLRWSSAARRSQKAYLYAMARECRDAAEAPPAAEAKRDG